MAERNRDRSGILLQKRGIVGFVKDITYSPTANEKAGLPKLL